MSEMNTEQIFAEDRRIEDFKQNPRGEFLQAIREKDMARCLVKTAEIHGHFCPGSALGVMASVHGLNLLGLDSISSDGLEDLMAVVETNACFADGVQAVSGCTLGNNALVYRDLGRLAVTFAIRGKETGVRIRVQPDFSSSVAKASPEFPCRTSLHTPQGPEECTREDNVVASMDMIWSSCRRGSISSPYEHV